MSEQPEQQENPEEKGLSFDVMPGADPLEAPEDISLAFDEPEPESENAGQTEGEEPEAETAAEEEASGDEETTEEVDGEATDDDDEPDSAEPEETVEEEPEEEEEELPLAAEAEEKTPKSPMVPKSRLDEVLAKQKALQKQVQEMQAAAEKPAEAPEEFDFDDAESKYMEAVLDGETQKANKIRSEIRAAEKAQIEWEMEQKMGQTVQQSAQATALQQAAAEMEANFPVFDQNSDQFNEEYTNEVVELRDAFIIKGYDPVDALGKAVNFVVKDRGLDDKTPDESALAAPQQKVEQTAKKKATVAKKLKAAESQPPELEGEGSSSRGENVVDFNSMSEDEFNALPEATLRRLRGDIV